MAPSGHRTGCLDSQNGVWIDTLVANPVDVVMAARPVVARRMRVLEVPVAVVDAHLAAVRGAGQVQLADEPAVIARVGEAAESTRRSPSGKVAFPLQFSGIELGYLPVRKEARLGVQIGA